jgi:hypothetical protein
MESPRSLEVDRQQTKLADLCINLGARAAGLWRVDQQAAQLVQVDFVPGAGLDPQVAFEFKNATQVVPLGQVTLGIVVAAMTGRPVISRVAELAAESGSGAWLRAFGASRSAAVPLFDEEERVSGAISVALPEDVGIDDATIADQLRRAME